MEVSGVLNVAHDLVLPERIQYQVECMQVGLVDGPGNLLSSYCAAVLALSALLDRHDKVIVCCHKGESRSVSVVLMHLSVTNGRGFAWPGDWEAGWDGWMTYLRLRSGTDLPEPHKAHKEAFEKMDWHSLTKLLRREG